MPTIWARLQSVGRSDWFVDFPASFANAPKPVVIGRISSATLSLSDCMTISNRHVTLEQRVSEDGKRTVVLYETSSNGTFINSVLYQKGQSKELADGDEVMFPADGVEPDKKQDYIFLFHVLDESFSAANRGAKLETASSEWTFIQEQCDELSKEAARLAATIYANSDRVKTLSKNLSAAPEAKHPFADIAEAMLAAMQEGSDRLKVHGEGDILRVKHWETELRIRGILPLVNMDSENDGK